MSIAERLAWNFRNLPPGTREAAIEAELGSLSETDLAALNSWECEARPAQWVEPEDDAPLVALIGGRGSGKTLGGSEAVCKRIQTGQLRRGALVSRTPGDVRRVMIEGDSGLIAVGKRRGIEFKHYPSLAQVVVPGTDITLSTFSAQEPDALRGPEFDTLWGDEFAAWPNKRDAVGVTAFDNATVTLRSGPHPLGIFTSTPKAVPSVRAVMQDTTGIWRVSRMTTWSNLAHLAPSYLATLIRLYGGTRLAAQEFEGLYVEDAEGSLWKTPQLEASRVHLEHGETWDQAADLPEMPWRWVGVDPSVSATGSGDECGIVAVGVGVDLRLYVLADWSGHMSPAAWADKAIALHREIGGLGIVAEVNNGGALVTQTIKNVDPTVPVEPVRAAHGKRARAEPVAMLWDDLDGETAPRASIVGSLPGLELQMTTWDARSTTSPDRIDALTWAATKALDVMNQSHDVSVSASGTRRTLPG